MGEQINDFTKIIEEIEEDRKNHPIKYFFLDLWHSIIWFFKLLPKNIYWSIQKLLRGYSNPEIWNLDSTLAMFLLKRLKAFRKMDRYCMPLRFAIVNPQGASEDYLSEEEWNEILDEIIFALEFTCKDSYDEYDMKKEEERKRWMEDSKRVGRGYILLGQYFQSLGD